MCASRAQLIGSAGRRADRCLRVLLPARRGPSAGRVVCGQLTGTIDCSSSDVFGRSCHCAMDCGCGAHDAHLAPFVISCQLEKSRTLAVRRSALLDPPHDSAFCDKISSASCRATFRHVPCVPILVTELVRAGSAGAASTALPSRSRRVSSPAACPRSSPLHACAQAVSLHPS